MVSLIVILPPLYFLEFANFVNGAAQKYSVLPSCNFKCRPFRALECLVACSFLECKKELQLISGVIGFQLQ